jgi:hypothetical protein
MIARAAPQLPASAAAFAARGAAPLIRFTHARRCVSSLHRASELAAAWMFPLAA